MDATFAARAHANQQQLLSNLKSSFDFIVCGSGSSGSVVARRLAENPDVSVLLLEAGGSDEVASIADPLRWPENLGTERDWAFPTRPNPDLNDRSLVWSMGRVLGGSSSINLMVWARGHQQDWDAYAEATGDPTWSYAAVLERYRRIESWQGVSDPVRRGRNGLVYVAPAAPNGHIAPTLLEAAKSVGIPAYADHNGSLMESESGGAALSNLRIQDGKRQSVYRTYVHPYLDRPNLTVLTSALVTRVLFENKRATGVEVVFDGRVKKFTANVETILSLGAVQTPKVLMQSGIGEAAHLRKWDIPVVRDLPGVGQNLQEHVLLAGCLWEYARPDQQHTQMADGTFFWRSDPALRGPDLQCFIIEAPFLSQSLQSRAPAGPAWTILPGLVRPKSRGRLYLTGSTADAPVDIDARILSEPADRVALRRCVELCREIGNSHPFAQFRGREAHPGPITAKELDTFISDATVPFWHYVGTAKMGRDQMSVVDGQLRVHGIDRLRVADGSVLPEVPTGNTMAPCVMVGEIAAELLKEAHR